MKAKMAVMYDSDTGKTGTKFPKGFKMPESREGLTDLYQLKLNIILTCLVSVLRSAAEQGLINKVKTLELIEDHIRSINVIDGVGDSIIDKVKVTGGNIFETK